MILTIKLVIITMICYIVMNRLFYYLDGDYKRTPNPRNRNPKNIMNNPHKLNRVILLTLLGLLSLFITLPYILN